MARGGGAEGAAGGRRLRTVSFGGLEEDEDEGGIHVISRLTDITGTLRRLRTGVCAGGGVGRGGEGGYTDEEDEEEDEEEGGGLQSMDTDTTLETAADTTVDSTTTSEAVSVATVFDALSRVLLGKDGVTAFELRESAILPELSLWLCLQKDHSNDMGSGDGNGDESKSTDIVNNAGSKDGGRAGRIPSGVAVSEVSRLVQEVFLGKADDGPMAGVGRIGKVLRQIHQVRRTKNEE